MRVTARAAVFKLPHPVAVVRRRNRVAVVRIDPDDSWDVFAAPAGILLGVASGSLIWLALACLALGIR
jgi:hypothetical protein